MLDPAAASTSGRLAVTASASVADARVSELCRQDAEVDALVRAECGRLRAGLEQARKRQGQALARAAALLLREKDAELDAVRRRAAELEGQAWCGLARTNEAVATGLRSALDTLLLRGAGAGAAPVAQQPVEEGFGESCLALVAEAADDAESCCFVEAEDAGAGTGTATSLSLAASNSGHAVRAAVARHRCWCCRAGTCACARRASPGRRHAPSASPPRPRPSTSPPTIDRVGSISGDVAN
ncbi:hypothetical protein BAE44_0005040 [Dichanthelium oligosanthes]|uniref:BOI-related E3 ubiquitin-protein ligase 3 n=1 Tax=Dichanthelium oligosanthes TaxID=888268 RepID=A0A1E5W977_9POAL|nr:hypothetical protein BAE44_0005040 [Dichanthelium oligosanthes]